MDNGRTEEAMFFCVGVKFHKSVCPELAHFLLFSYEPHRALGIFFSAEDTEAQGSQHGPRAHNELRSCPSSGLSPAPLWPPTVARVVKAKARALLITGRHLSGSWQLPQPQGQCGPGGCLLQNFIHLLS